MPESALMSEPVVEGNYLFISGGRYWETGTSFPERFYILNKNNGNLVFEGVLEGKNPSFYTNQPNFVTRGVVDYSNYGKSSSETSGGSSSSSKQEEFIYKPSTGERILFNFQNFMDEIRESWQEQGKYEEWAKYAEPSNEPVVLEETGCSGNFCTLYETTGDGFLMLTLTGVNIAIDSLRTDSVDFKMKRGDDQRIIYGPKEMKVGGEYNENGFKLIVEKIGSNYVVLSYEYVESKNTLLTSEGKKSVAISKDRWTMALNTDRPGGTGDIESRASIYSEYDLSNCNIQDIRCEGRFENTDIFEDYSKLGQKLEVGCTLEGGIVCKNNQQTSTRTVQRGGESYDAPSCADYQVRFYCGAGTGSVSTTTGKDPEDLTPFCSDPDGKDYYVFGRTEYFREEFSVNTSQSVGWFRGFGEFAAEDGCIDNKTLREFYCEGVNIKWEEITCSNGCDEANRICNKGVDEIESEGGEGDYCTTKADCPENDYSGTYFCDSSEKNVLQKFKSWSCIEDKCKLGLIDKVIRSCSGSERCVEGECVGGDSEEIIFCVRTSDFYYNQKTSGTSKITSNLNNVETTMRDSCYGDKTKEIRCNSNGIGYTEEIRECEVDGEVCRKGTCVDLTVVCEENSDCPPDKWEGTSFCNEPNTHTSQKYVSYTCGEDKVCVSSEEMKEKDYCPKGCEIGVCLGDVETGCLSDDECSEGLVCRNGVCLLGSSGESCFGDFDCSELGEYCKDGFCEARTSGGKANCTDSDGGAGVESKFIKGIVKEGLGGTYSDYCSVDKTQVKEYSCNSNGIAVGNWTDCPEGTLCSEGACVEEEDNSCFNGCFYNGISTFYKDKCFSYGETTQSSIFNYLRYLVCTSTGEWVREGSLSPGENCEVYVGNTSMWSKIGNSLCGGPGSDYDYSCCSDPTLDSYGKCSEKDKDCGTTSSGESSGGEIERRTTKATMEASSCDFEGGANYLGILDSVQVTYLDGKKEVLYDLCYGPEKVWEIDCVDGGKDYEYTLKSCGEGNICKEGICIEEGVNCEGCFVEGVCYYQNREINKDKYCDSFGEIKDKKDNGENCKYSSECSSDNCCVGTEECVSSWYLFWHTNSC